MRSLKLTFWGVRGSTPTPEISKLGVGGETSCIEILTSHNELIVFDMGTGLRNLGNKLLQSESYPRTGYVFLSHTHWDHIQGALTFTPIFEDTYKFKLFYGEKDGILLSEALRKILHYKLWPVTMKMIEPSVEFNVFQDKPIIISENTKVITNLHTHPSGAYSYRLESDGKSIVYVTDCEHPKDKINNSVVELAKDADILIHDAHFTPSDLDNHRGWGHSSWKEAVAVAKSANVKQLILFHFSPNYNDQDILEIERLAKAEFPNTIIAKQGLTLNI
jgi:phosphoribosyl 1,2-cyclic phosphodiesterase